jgi:hypothetical protein
MNLARLAALARAIPEDATFPIDRCTCAFSVRDDKGQRPEYPLGVVEFHRQGLHWLPIGGGMPPVMRYGNFLNFEAVREFFDLTREQTATLFVEHPMQGSLPTSHVRSPANVVRAEIVVMIASEVGELLAAPSPPILRLGWLDMMVTR